MNTFSTLSFAILLFIALTSTLVSAGNAVFISLKKPATLNTTALTNRQVKTLNFYLNVAWDEYVLKYPGDLRHLRGSNKKDGRGRHLHSGHNPATCAQCRLVQTKLECQVQHSLCARRLDGLDDRPNNGSVIIRQLHEELDIYPLPTFLESSNTSLMDDFACTFVPQNVTLYEANTLAAAVDFTFANNLSPGPTSGNATMLNCQS